MNNKAHLSIEGLNQIINIRSSINLGLSQFLKTEFPNNTPINRPEIIFKGITDPNWISGFVTGDGCFDVNIPKTTNKLGYRVQLRFRITQHERDRILMENLMKYFFSGHVYKYPKQSAISLVIFNYSDIYNRIIPFFEKNPLLGVKLLEYKDWCKIAKLMKEGSHLTVEGLNLIQLIKSGMNNGRSFT